VRHTFKEKDRAPTPDNQDYSPLSVGVREDPGSVLPGLPGSISYIDSCQQLGPCISANVQPIYQAGILTTHFLFGWNNRPSGFQCGKIISKVVCSENEDHKPYYKHEYCNDPLCPVCYTKFTNRISAAALQRVLGFRSVYPGARLDHIVFWPDSLTGYTNLKEAYQDAQFMMKRLGVVAAVVWFHPYRIKEEIKMRLRRYKNEKGLPSFIGFWKLAHQDVLGLGGLEEYVVPGPHFHAISQGYLPNSLEYAKLQIGGYKKVRILDSEADIEKMCYYVSTHACYESGKSTIRYYGKISYRRLGCIPGEDKIENLVCSVCGKRLKEYYFNPDLGLCTGLRNLVVTRVVRVDRYYERGKKPPGWCSTVQTWLVCK